MVNALARVSSALAPAYEELAAQVPTEPVLNIDESGWKDNGKRYWLWVFATATISIFVLARYRSSQVLRDIPGQTYDGTLISDFFSAYVKYANGFQQFCLAHLIRDVKFLVKFPDRTEQVSGKALFRFLFDPAVSAHYFHTTMPSLIPRIR